MGVPNRPASAGNRTGEDRPMGESNEKSSIMMPNIPERANTNVANKYLVNPLIVVTSPPLEEGE